MTGWFSTLRRLSVWSASVGPLGRVGFSSSEINPRAACLATLYELAEAGAHCFGRCPYGPPVIQDAGEV